MVWGLKIHVSVVQLRLWAPRQSYSRQVPDRARKNWATSRITVRKLSDTTITEAVITMALQEFSMRTILSIMLTPVLLTACGDSGDMSAIDMSAVEFQGQPIYGGSVPSDPRFDAVVGLYIRKGRSTYICSGTLIAPDVVASAAHCFAEARGKGIVLSSASDVDVFFGAEIGGAGVAVSEVLVHAGYDPRRYGVDDLALLRLVAPVTIPPMAHLPTNFANREAVGTPVIFAGYGSTETGTIGKKLVVGGSLSDVTTTGLRNEQDDATGTCGGDSGGPLIYDFDSTLYVGGTTSWGDSACTDYGWSMRVSAYDSWINDFIAGPQPECTINSDCNDGNDCTYDLCNAGSCVYPDNGTCVCAPKRTACTANAECCSNNCVRGSCR